MPSRQTDIFGSRDGSEYNPALHCLAEISIDETKAYSGSTLAVASLIERCEAYHRRSMKERKYSGRADAINATPGRRRLAGRYQNLIALHWLRMSLAAFTMLDEECLALRVTDHEHMPAIDEDESSKAAADVSVTGEPESAQAASGWQPEEAGELATGHSPSCRTAIDGDMAPGESPAAGRVTGSDPSCPIDTC
ncbi:MAG TPA: hypothetical protein VFW87_05700 [Pirellulales bacterium]|nr:hypothetical protein [Pirellulales bacterium]